MGGLVLCKSGQGFLVLWMFTAGGALFPRLVVKIIAWSRRGCVATNHLALLHLELFPYLTQNCLSVGYSMRQICMHWQERFLNMRHSIPKISGKYWTHYRRLRSLKLRALQILDTGSLNCVIVLYNSAVGSLSVQVVLSLKQITITFMKLSTRQIRANLAIFSLVPDT